MRIQTPNALAAEDKEDEETAYLKFVSQVVKQSDKSSTASVTIQLPEGSKRTSNTCKRIPSPTN